MSSFIPGVRHEPGCRKVEKELVELLAKCLAADYSMKLGQGRRGHAALCRSGHLPPRFAGRRHGALASRTLNHLAAGLECRPVPHVDGRPAPVVSRPVFIRGGKGVRPRSKGRVRQRASVRDTWEPTSGSRRRGLRCRGLDPAIRRRRRRSGRTFVLKMILTPACWSEPSPISRFIRSGELQRLHHASSTREARFQVAR
jgi:hypothetical protein